VPSLPWGSQPPFAGAAARQPPVCPSSTVPAGSQHWGGGWERPAVPLLPLLLLPFTCLPPFLLFLLLTASDAIAPGVDISAGGPQARFEERTTPGTRTPRVSAVITWDQPDPSWHCKLGDLGILGWQP